MHSIAYVVPYFGRFPKGFEFWLLGCQCNPTIDWLIFTDDERYYSYPNNVKVTYCSFESMKSRIQQLYDFPISLERPYKLCDFRPAYGEIFKEELREYDFWGHCDIDLVWGDIRAFYTEEVLSRYEKIGFNGHSTLYRNSPEVCARYRTHIEGKQCYEEVYGTDKGFAFDEIGMAAIYESLGISAYTTIDFASLVKYDYGFFLDWGTEEDRYKNAHQVFTWENGHLYRHYLHDDVIEREEYAYLHYWCRPTTFRISKYDKEQKYLIYADTTTDKKFELTQALILRKSKRNKVRYYVKSIWFNRKKITLERIIFNVKGMIKYKSR